MLRKQDVSFCQKRSQEVWGFYLFFFSCLFLFLSLSLSFSCSFPLLLPPPPSQYLSAPSTVRGRAEMAVAETQLYAKVANKHRSKSPSVLLESLLAKGFPAHIAWVLLSAAFVQYKVFILTTWKQTAFHQESLSLLGGDVSTWGSGLSGFECLVEQHVFFLLLKQPSLDPFLKILRISEDTHPSASWGWEALQWIKSISVVHSWGISFHFFHISLSLQGSYMWM